MRRYQIILIVAVILMTAGKMDVSAQKIVDEDVIIDASDFIDDLPRWHQIYTAQSLGVDWVWSLDVDWLYNNFAIRFITQAGFSNSNYMKDIVIQGDGVYYICTWCWGREEYFPPAGERGYKHVQARQPNNDPDYLRHTITNHTHY